MLRIMIIGYYGHLNAGDDLLQQAMTYIFQDHKLTFCSWLPSMIAMNECDLIVIGGGSIWPGFEVFQQANDVAKNLSIPLFVMGISAKKPDKEVKSQTFKLIEKSSFFHVRDQSTAHEFDDHPDVISGVDLFWWMPWSSPPSSVSIPNANTVAVNLRDWNELTWRAEAIIDAIQAENLTILGLPLYFGSTNHDSNIRRNDLQLLQDLNIQELTNHFSYQPICDAEFTIAMRFHAVLLSVRLGRPVISFTYHPKLVNFFEEHSLSELCVDLDQPNQLSSAIRNLKENYHSYKLKFEEIRASLENSGQENLLECHSVLRNIRKRKPYSFLKRVILKTL